MEGQLSPPASPGWAPTALRFTMLAGEENTSKLDCDHILFSPRAGNLLSSLPRILISLALE